MIHYLCVPLCTYDPGFLGGSRRILGNLLLFSVLIQYQYPMISVIGPPMDDHAIETPIRPPAKLDTTIAN